MIDSLGYEIGALVFLSNKAIANETLPTRPQNINSIKTICEIIFKVGVILAVRPTVLIAENVSTKAFESVIGSTAQIIKAPLKAKVRFIVVISSALFKNSLRILF